MKKKTSMIILIVIFLHALFPISITAYADIPNVIISGPESKHKITDDTTAILVWNSVNGSNSPSEEDLKSIESGIEYPEKKEYLDHYNYGVVQAPGGHSVYCYGSADMQGSKYTVADGAEVVIIARRGQMLCVIIPSLNKARWIREANIQTIDVPDMSNETDIPDEDSNKTWVQVYSLRDYGYTSMEIEYFFNADNSIASFHRHDINMDGTEFITETKRLYDSNGIVVSCETRDSVTGELLETELWEYSPDQKVKKIYTYDWTGTLKAEQRYTYSDDGYTIEYTLYDDNGQQSRRNITRFDLDGNELYRENYDEFNELRDSTQTIYNADKEKEKEIHYTAIINTRNIIEYTYLYDRNGRHGEATGIYTSGNMEGKKEVTKYSYDKYGNLIQETQFLDGEIVFQISYRWALLENGQVVKLSE